MLVSIFQVPALDLLDELLDAFFIGCPLYEETPTYEGFSDIYRVGSQFLIESLFDNA